MFSAKNRKKNRTESVTISAVEFIRRFLLHSLPTGLVRIRHFGFWANCNRKAHLSEVRALLGLAPATSSAPVGLEELINRLTGIGITAYPCCHRGKMRFLAEIPNYWPAPVGCIFPEPVGNVLGNEHDLMFPSGPGLSQIQLPVLEITGGELQHLTDAHAPSGHQFQDQPVTDFARPENDLIDGLFFDDVLVGGDFRAKQLSQHRRIAGILEIRAQVVVDKIEKRCQVGKSDFPGLRFATVGDAFQESLNKVNREFLQLSVAVVPAEWSLLIVRASSGIEVA